jgi:NitT/TauT family transport system permease protein
VSRRGRVAAAGRSTVGILVAIAIWSLIATKSGVADETPAPWEVAAATQDLAADGVLRHAVLETTKAFVSGWAIAVALGLLIGALMANSRVVRDTLTPLVELLRPIPSVAVIPLAIVFFGLGDRMKITVIVYASIWPVLLTAADALRRVDPLLAAVCRQFGLRGRARYFLRVQLPSALPELVTAARTASIIAMALTIVAELVSTGRGLGNWIVEYELALRVPEMYACIIIAMILGAAVYSVTLGIERRLLRWAPRVARDG